jgi:hydrogenase maturation factor
MRVLAALGKRARAFSDALFPAGAKFDVEKPQAPGGDFVLMGNPSGAEHQGHRGELLVFPAVALAVVTTKQEPEEGQFVGMHGEFALDWMAEIAEDSVRILDAMADVAEELAAAQRLLSRGDGLGTRHGPCPPDPELERSRMLLLF